MQTRTLDIDTRNPIQPDKDALATLLHEQSDKLFFEKNTPYTLSSGEVIALNCALIKSQDPDHKDTLFYVISGDSAGKGSFSHFRPCYLQVTIQSDNSVTLQPIPEAIGVRIKNTQAAEKRRRALQRREYVARREKNPNESFVYTPYDPNEAVSDYEKMHLLTPELNAQPPITILKNKPALEAGIAIEAGTEIEPDAFYKSYSVMRRRFGVEYELGFFELIKNDLLNTQLIVREFLSLMKRYKAGFSDNGMAHRDIRSDNILFDYDNDETAFHFIDVDSAKPHGEADTSYGAPGYIAMEAADGVPVSSARDIYSFGILFTGAINNDLSVQYFIRKVYKAAYQEAMTGQDIIHQQYLLLDAMHCYDPDALIQEALKQESHNFIKKAGYVVGQRDVLFRYVTEDVNEAVLAARYALTELLKGMTQLKPESRSTLNAVIETLERISNDLAIAQRASLTSGGSQMDISTSTSDLSLFTSTLMSDLSLSTSTPSSSMSDFSVLDSPHAASSSGFNSPRPLSQLSVFSSPMSSPTTPRAVPAPSVPSPLSSSSSSPFTVHGAGESVGVAPLTQGEAEEQEPMAITPRNITPR